MQWGYFRSSERPGTIMMQRNSVKIFCCAYKFTPPDKYAGEIVSGRKPWRERGIGEILAKARKGDVVYATDMSRLSRNFFDLMEISRYMIEHGIILRLSRFPVFELGNRHEQLAQLTMLCLQCQAELEMLSRRMLDMRAKRKDGVRDKLMPYAPYIRRAFVSYQIPIRRLARAYKVDAHTMKKFVVVNLGIEVEKYIWGNELVPKSRNDEIRAREELRQTMMRIDPYEDPELWQKRHGPLPYDVQVSIAVGTFPNRFYYPDIEPFRTDVDIALHQGIISPELQKLVDIEKEEYARGIDVKTLYKNR